jgi:hypothetical protein
MVGNMLIHAAFFIDLDAHNQKLKPGHHPFFIEVDLHQFYYTKVRQDVKSRVR